MHTGRLIWTPRDSVLVQRDFAPTRASQADSAPIVARPAGGSTAAARNPCQPALWPIGSLDEATPTPIGSLLSGYPHAAVPNSSCGPGPPVAAGGGAGARLDGIEPGADAGACVPSLCAWNPGHPLCGAGAGRCAGKPAPGSRAG